MRRASGANPLSQLIPLDRPSRRILKDEELSGSLPPQLGALSKLRGL